MVHRYIAGTFLLFVLAGARPAAAAALTFSGITQTDFSSANTLGNDNYAAVSVLSNPTDLGVESFIPANGWVSGWAVKGIEMSYSASNDTMYVGLDGFKNASGNYAIFGDADGNGNPGGASTQMSAVGGVDPASMGGDKSIALAIAAYNPSNPGQPGAAQIIAGIPADKSLAGTGIDGFKVASLNTSSGLLQNSFGSALGNVGGNLAFDPSSSKPELEFSITNFSKSGIDPTKGFWVELYAGSGQDVVAGEAELGLDVRAPRPGPEPARTNDLDRLGDGSGWWNGLALPPFAAAALLTHVPSHSSTA